MRCRLLRSPARRPHGAPPPSRNRSRPGPARPRPRAQRPRAAISDSSGSGRKTSQSNSSSPSPKSPVRSVVIGPSSQCGESEVGDDRVRGVRKDPGRVRVADERGRPTSRRRGCRVEPWVHVRLSVRTTLGLSPVSERRRWDLNPRLVAQHTISSRADSAALALLRDCSQVRLTVPPRPDCSTGDPALARDFPTMSRTAAPFDSLTRTSRFRVVRLARTRRSPGRAWSPARRGARSPPRQFPGRPRRGTSLRSGGAGDGRDATH